jgi:hypothetical protein
VGLERTSLGTSSIASSTSLGGRGVERAAARQEKAPAKKAAKKS